MTPEVILATQADKFLERGPGYIYQLIKRKRVESFRVGHTVYIEKESLDAYLRHRRNTRSVRQSRHRWNIYDLPE